MEGTQLKEKELNKWREVLEERRKEILKTAQRTLEQGMTLDSEDLADEMALASSEHLHAFNFRVRGREKHYLSKDDQAIKRIDNGTFGICQASM